MFIPRVVLIQILFVVIIWSVGKFGKKPLVVATIVLLLASLLQIFSPPLFVLQVTVILATAAVRYHKIREEEVRQILAAFHSILDRLSGK